jgi:hypothetical protein
MSKEAGWSNGDDERSILVELLIPTALNRHDGSLRDSDALDTKALGMLAVVATALALLAATYQHLHGGWWLPAIGLAAAGILLILAVWPRRFDLGPDLEQFYEEMAGSSPLQASRQMLAELLAATDHNRKPDKIRFFWWGLVLLVISLAGCVPVIVFRT